MKVKSLYPIIATKNLKEAIDFYKDLGFEVKHDAVTKMGSHVCVMNCGDLEIEIMEAVSGGPITIPEGLYGFRMNVDDIEKVAEELKKKGATVVGGPIETSVGKNMFIKDNQGINITLIEHVKSK